MPSRNAPRCTRRAGPERLDQITELNLTSGGAFDVEDWEFHDVEQFRVPWARWGAEITRRWIEAFPGSRPFTVYILGELPPARWQHDNPMLRHPLRRIAGCTITVPDRTWHTYRPEFDHLVRIGVVDGRERVRARARFASDSRPSYDQISTDNNFS